MFASFSDDDLSLADAREMLLEVGVHEDEVLLIIAEACRRQQVISTGFVHMHHQDNHVSNPKRTRIPANPWRVIAATDPINPHFSQEQKAAFEACAHWSTSSISFTHLETGRQATWDGVSLDRSTFLRLAAREAAKVASKGRDTDEDVRAWIAAYPGLNSREGWRDYYRTKKLSAAKKTLFEQLWKEASGGRKRGRPPRKAACQ